MAIAQKSASFYLVPVLFFAYVLTQRSQQLNWFSFAGFMLSLLFLSIPILIWALWSESRSLARPAFWSRWSVAFILYPAILMFMLGLQPLFLSVITQGNLAHAWGGGSIVALFFLAELLLSLALMANERWRERPRFRPRLPRSKMPLSLRLERSGVSWSLPNHPVRHDRFPHSFQFSQLKSICCGQACKEESRLPMSAWAAIASV